MAKEEKKKKAPTRRKFKVREHRSFHYKNEDGALIKALAGNIVNLTVKEAKLYHKHGCLDPIIDDIYDEETDDGEAQVRQPEEEEVG